MTSPILRTLPLGHPWTTLDPFLFCVHHLDRYPAANAQMGLDASQLRGRSLGSDFSGKDGWSMYHGQRVPGFPPHPHRGFETVTIARQGFIDHADSLGARARFGQGDVQWMTAGRGVMHSEMFPLMRQDSGNTTELFQIWLNLPASHKMVEPAFTMLWHEGIPVIHHVDDQGGATDLTLIAGAMEQARALAPPSDSWASNPEAHVGIFTLVMSPGASFELAPTHEGSNRALYFFEGQGVEIAGRSYAEPTGLQLAPDAPVSLRNTGADPAQILVLQGRPLNEPVVQHGPFVMNSSAQIREAVMDYQRTQFGGWPHDTSHPVWPATQGRFAQHVDGRLDEP